MVPDRIGAEPGEGQKEAPRLRLVRDLSDDRKRSSALDVIIVLVLQP